MKLSRENLKQGAVIQLQELGKCSIPVQWLPLKGFIVPCLLSSFTFHFFVFIRKKCCIFFTNSQQKGKPKSSVLLSFLPHKW